jgi:hypothetical protein
MKFSENRSPIYRGDFLYASEMEGRWKESFRKNHGFRPLATPTGGDRLNQISKQGANNV